MKKLRKSFIAKWLTTVLIACILICSVDLGMPMTARAGDISIESDETSGTEDALQEQSESALESEPEAEEPKPGVIESEEPEKPDAGEKEPDTEEKESEEPDVEEKEPEASEPEKEEPDQELTEPEGRSEEPEEEQTEEVLNSVELKAEADGYEFLLKGTTDQLTSAEADLKLIVEPMKEELEKAAGRKGYGNTGRRACDRKSGRISAKDIRWEQRDRTG